MCRTREEIIRLLMTSLLQAVPNSFTTQQLLYWSSGNQYRELEKEVEKILTGICTSEWWQMLAVARILVKPSDICHVNEIHYPLGRPPSTTVKVRVCQLKRWANSTRHAQRILAKRGQRPATLREVLIYLAEEKRKAWGWVDKTGINIFQSPITKDKNDRNCHCLYVRDLLRLNKIKQACSLDKIEAPMGEIFMMHQRSTYPYEAPLGPRDWVFVVDL